MKRLILFAALAPPMAMSSLTAQGRLSRQEVLSYTAYYWDGPGSISDADRRRVLADPAAIEVFAQLIDGEIPWPRGSDTATVLFWLGESGDRRFVPTFLRFARTPRTRRQANMFVTAVAGLARNADVPDAANRLRSLLVDPNEPDAAYQVAGVLATINDEPARRVLAELPVDELSVPLRELVSHTLASPALPRGSRSAYPADTRRVPRPRR